MTDVLTVRPDGSRRLTLVCDEPSLTRQSEADSADVNKIVARFEKTGVLPMRQDGMFLDVSEVPDYRGALEQVRMVNEYFSQLPAGVRAEFDNDPAAFLDFAVKPESEARLRELGILEREKAAEPPAAAPGAPGGATQ